MGRVHRWGGVGAKKRGLPSRGSQVIGATGGLLRFSVTVVVVG